MHNQTASTPGRHGRAATLIAVCAAIVAVGAACVPREKDAGRFASLPVDKPVFKEYKGANIYLMRQTDGELVVFWGISPLGSGDGGRVTCFIQDRTDRPFRGETRPFIDPCRGAWWSRDGRFLGYTSDPADQPSTGPPLVRIPAEVRGDRIVLDEKVLRCLQSRVPRCLDG